jgi:hypothetical protein
MKKYYLLFIVLFSVFCFFSSDSCQAAVLYFESQKENYHEEDVFIIKILINTEGECVNAVDSKLIFNPEILEIKDFSKGNSIISLWLKDPVFSNEEGSISFTGGIPGGYCGKIKGDPGESNILGRIIFKAKKEGFSELNFSENSEILLNDGLGNKAKLERKKIILNILPGKSETLNEEWQKEIEEDKIPPEFFEIKISQESSVFEGKYFIAFSTIDKQTGIDRYEIKEGQGLWEEISSPYLLKDQSLKSEIQVKAIDKAENETIAEYQPMKEIKKEKESIKYFILIVFLFFVVIGILLFIFRKKNICRKTKL